MEQPLVAEHRGPMRRNQFAHETTAAAPAAHTRYLSSSAAAILHGETQGFVLRLPLQGKAHATFMQPVQCILQHSPGITHFPSLRTWQQSITTIMQPFQCDLQPEIQETQELRTQEQHGTHSLQNTEFQ